MSSIHDLMRILRDEANFVAKSKKHIDSRTPIVMLFRSVIDQTNTEIANGANSEDFAELVVINLIIAAAKEGHSSTEIKKFVAMLNEDLEEEQAGTLIEQS